jgi:hypothetical protein
MEVSSNRTSKTRGEEPEGQQEYIALAFTPISLILLLETLWQLLGGSELFENGCRHSYKYITQLIDRNRRMLTICN